MEFNFEFLVRIVYTKASLVKLSTFQLVNITLYIRQQKNCKYIKNIFLAFDYITLPKRGWIEGTKIYKIN